MLHENILKLIKKMYLYHEFNNFFYQLECTENLLQILHLKTLLYYIQMSALMNKIFDQNVFDHLFISFIQTFF